MIVLGIIILAVILFFLWAILKIGGDSDDNY